MTILRRWLLVLACVLAWTLPVPQAASDEDRTSLFLNVTTDDVWAAEMAFFYAENVIKMGHPVAVFLNVRGVRLAHKTAPQAAGASSGKPPRQMLADLIAKGATVYACGMCTKEAGMTEADWIEGVRPGGPETIKLQMAPATKVMSY